VDIDASKLELIRLGHSPIVEDGMQDLMADVVGSGRVDVTQDVTRAIHPTDISFLCVGTPCRPNGSQDLRALERLSAQLGTAMATKQRYHVFVVRSTVIPGRRADHHPPPPEAFR